MKVRSGFYLISVEEVLKEGFDLAIVEQEEHGVNPNPQPDGLGGYDTQYVATSSFYCHVFTATRKLADEISEKTKWSVQDEEGTQDNSPALLADGLDTIQVARGIRKHYPNAEFQFDYAEDASDWAAGKMAGASARDTDKPVEPE